jgi:hypothetical protein
VKADAVVHVMSGGDDRNQRGVDDFHAMMLGDRLDEVVGKVPVAGKPSAGRAVVDVKQLPFAFQLVEIVLASHDEQVVVLHRVAGQQSEAPDVVEQAGGVGAVLGLIQGLRQLFGDERASDAVVPANAQPVHPHEAARKTAQGHGQRQPLDHFGAQHDHGVRNIVDPAAQPVERRIGHAQDLRRQRRVDAQQADDFLDRGVGIVQQAHQLQRYSRKRGQRVQRPRPLLLHVASSRFGSRGRGRGLHSIPTVLIVGIGRDLYRRAVDRRGIWACLHACQPGARQA